MSEEYTERRKRLDHERYLSKKEERQKKQRAYYAANRGAILKKKKETGFLTYGKAR